MRNEASSSNNSSGRGETVVAGCGLYRSTCGYCRTSGRETSIAHVLRADSLTVHDYQGLLDRGWRRSGCFLYKPNMKETCCPSYTIRLKAHDFVRSKEQKRVSRRMQRYLEGTLDVKKFAEFLEDPSTSNHYDSLSSVKKETLSHSNEENNKTEQLLHDLSVQINNAVHTCIESGDFPSGIQLPKASVKIVSQAKRKLLAEGMENLLYSSNIAFQVVATLRQAQLAEKEVQQIQVLRQNTQDNGPSEKVIAEKLASSLNKPIENFGLSIRACNGHLNFYSAMNQSPSDNGIQIAILSEESSDVNSKRRCVKSSPKHPQGKRHRLQIHLKRSSFDPQEYALYRRYQIKVHHDKPDQVNEDSYRRFLVDTPLVFVPPSGDATVPPCGFGSFHQQYLIDDQLVAVGVIDILPRCLSSKYLFWDPDFAFLSLGKYSALQEIDWVIKNQVHCLPLEYYYLGYYIHSCRKMRYKAAYRPSELLCPLRYQWVRYDVARPLLDKRPYVVLTDFASLQDQEASSPSVSANATELQHHDIGQADSNDVLMDYEEEMLEPESETELQNQEASSPSVSANATELQHHDIAQADSNDVLMDYEEELLEPESETDDDEPESETDDDLSDSETSGLNVGLDGDITNILIGLNQSRVRYKDVQEACDPILRRSLESRLHRYLKVVGAELSERMVYKTSHTIFFTN